MISAIVLSIVLLAQAGPGVASQPLETGPCLDAPRPVPRVLQPPVSRSMQVIRIEKVVSTATMMPGTVIGFLYTLEDGSTWLGQRTEEYMSAAGATQMNQILAMTHMPGENVSKFPPQMRQGVATKYTQFFKVQIPPGQAQALKVEIDPCVAWPATRTLPDPAM